MEKEFTLQPEYATEEYLNRLSKKIISDQRHFHAYRIQALTHLQKTILQTYPDKVRYQTETGSVDIDFIVAVELIQYGKSKDARGFSYKIIEP